jgi:hypothetical protein
LRPCHSQFRLWTLAALSLGLAMAIDRTQLNARRQEIESQFQEVRVARLVDGDPAEFEDRLLSEQYEIDRLLRLSDLDGLK